MSWVDVRHDLPEKGERCLVYSERYGLTLATYVDQNKHGNIWQYDGEQIITFNGPLFWMSLPKLPLNK